MNKHEPISSSNLILSSQNLIIILTIIGLFFEFLPVYFQAKKAGNPFKSRDKKKQDHYSDKVRPKTIAMINTLPKNKNYIFNTNVRTTRKLFAKMRNRLSKKLQNPRLKQIHFHTLRH